MAVDFKFVGWSNIVIVLDGVETPVSAIPAGRLREVLRAAMERWSDSEDSLREAYYGEDL